MPTPESYSGRVGTRSRRESRRNPRRPTCWVATCKVGGRVVPGAVLDISRRGAFFCPEEGQPLALSVGQIVVISFESEPTLAGIEVPCRVRWIGVSATHGRHGFGLEFGGSPPDG
ncbi:MAG TPA: PilZ domain-containing protein [Kofleriaceae bacterium]|nr:PilZ domain-containing protein [Kofleriaceae bacterium]